MTYLPPDPTPAWQTIPPAPPPGAQYIGQWNWGAFLLTPWWLMNHGRAGRGVLYLVLSIVPFVNLFSTIGMGIAYGMKGNEVAATSRRFVDDAHFVSVQNAWRNWGFGLLVVGLVLGVISGLLGARHAPVV